jgi:hypothetical protein
MQFSPRPHLLATFFQAMLNLPRANLRAVLEVLYLCVCVALLFLCRG